METKEYFEKVMQSFNQHRNGRSLRKYCQDEGIDYKWLQEYKRIYPNEPTRSELLILLLSTSVQRRLAIEDEYGKEA